MPRYDRPPGFSYGGGSGGNTIADLIMARGQAEAEGAYRSGDMWANTVAGLGQQIGGAIQQSAEKKRLKKQDEAWLNFVSSPEWQKDPTVAYAGATKILGPERGPKAAEGLMAFQGLRQAKGEQAMAFLPKLAGAMDAMSPDGRNALYPSLREAVVTAIPEFGKSLPETYNEEIWPELSKAARGLGGQQQKQGEAYTLAPGGQRRGPNNEVLAENPVAPEGVRPETRGIDVQAAEALAKGDTATYQRLLKVKKEMGQADDRPQAAGTPSGMSPTMEANVINRLSKQWSTSVAPVVELDRQLKIMDTGIEAARKGDLAQGAQMVLVTFQKILDPPSVVRESEYMRSSSGLSLMSRVKGAVEQLRKGGAKVPVPELEKFANLARQAAKAQAGGYSEAVKERIGKTADRYKIPRELVFEDFQFEGQGGPPGPAPGGAPQVGATKKFPNGRTGVWDGQGWVAQ